MKIQGSCIVFFNLFLTLISCDQSLRFKLKPNNFSIFKKETDDPNQKKKKHFTLTYKIFSHIIKHIKS